MLINCSRLSKTSELFCLTFPHMNANSFDSGIFKLKALSFWDRIQTIVNWLRESNPLPFFYWNKENSLHQQFHQCNPRMLPGGKITQFTGLLNFLTYLSKIYKISIQFYVQVEIPQKFGAHVRIFDQKSVFGQKMFSVSSAIALKSPFVIFLFHLSLRLVTIAKSFVPCC